MASLKSGLDSIAGAKCICDLHLLQSLIGRLVHACQVLPLGKAFLNHLFHLAGSMHPGHIRRLDSLVRADINWRQIMCDGLSGILVHQYLFLQQPAHHLFTDACGSWGCEAWSSPFWFNFRWEGENPLHSIALKELFPIGGLGHMSCAILIMRSRFAKLIGSMQGITLHPTYSAAWHCLWPSLTFPSGQFI